MTTWVKGDKQNKPRMGKDTNFTVAPCPNCFQAGHLNFQETDGKTTKKPCPWCSGAGWIPQVKIKT